MFDIAYQNGFFYEDLYDNIAAYCGTGVAYCYVAVAGTAAYAAYAGTLSGWSPGPGLNSVGDPTYYITELTDNTGTILNAENQDRFAQELRLTSKDEGQRFQWMIGGFYEKFTDNYVFRGIVDNFGDSIAGQILETQSGLVVRRYYRQNYQRYL